jgi:hypothetical protein
MKSFTETKEIILYSSYYLFYDEEIKLHKQNIVFRTSILFYFLLTNEEMYLNLYSKCVCRFCSLTSDIHISNTNTNTKKKNKKNVKNN